MEQQPAERAEGSQAGRIEYMGQGIDRQVITTDKAPKAVGPYSQAIRADSTIFASMQIGIDPTTAKLVEGDIAVQTRQVLNNLKAVLEAADSSLASVVKTTVFLTNIDDFSAMNQIYAEFFPQMPPARSTAQVVKLPLGAVVAIEAVAFVE